MNVTIVGTGYVGLVTGACLAELGHRVLCLDLDERKIARLARGEVPIYEPGLPELVARNMQERRLRFSADVAKSVAFADVQFIAVGTPAGEDGGADLRHVHAAARAIGEHMDRFKVIVQKSTVPVGSAEQVGHLVREALDARARPIDFAVVSNPEFLKEGAAVEDWLDPDRIILGVTDDMAGRRALKTMRELYAPLERERERTQVMDLRSAELTKYAANAMLATRISLMNELANLADLLGADIEQVRLGIGSDPRIGPGFLRAGCGYGGSCFPKDVEALCRTGHAHGHRMRVLESVQAVNGRQRLVLLEKIRAHFGPDLSGRRFAVLGLAFKPGTDDMREAPSRAIVAGLVRAGAEVLAHDPVAMDAAARALAQDLAESPSLQERIRFSPTPMEALRDADAMVLVTEWAAYRNLDPAVYGKAMRRALVFDGRNLYDPHQLAAAGVACVGVGRSNLAQREKLELRSTALRGRTAAAAKESTARGPKTRERAASG